MIAGEMQDVSVLGDSASLKQALRIFIDNACKYTPPGGKVTVSCTRGGLGALLSVADTGRGIPAADLKKIFDRFYRVDDSRGAVPGHGLGLSIARIIAVSHGGRINVRSKEGAGSVFTLELPGIRSELGAAWDVMSCAAVLFNCKRRLLWSGSPIWLT